MLKFLKSTLFTGLLILLPVLFLIIIIKEFLELIIGLATTKVNSGSPPSRPGKKLGKSAGASEWTA